MCVYAVAKQCSMLTVKQKLKPQNKKEERSNSWAAAANNSNGRTHLPQLR